ncbi:two-component sensor histidine kinase [Neobacillus niacini]|jgi:two-component system, sensor histidine kinase PdtaS|uniref:sensor histidine kinase n=1 Tax=Neobacillus niacini TaxID=86668 RepID=UPI0027895278|nr:sensor histidine kinase [Neobacillus niacini]MDQ1002732.1 two-component sensor histidine kinase [Neobacillus niacini]
MKNNMLEELCYLHTNLSKEDVLQLQELVGNLPLIADLNKANIFVDCLTKEGKHAIVVAEAAPTTTKPVYKKSVVGKFAYEAFEPSVLYTLRTGKPAFQNRALTQEGKTVDQSVVPINGANDRVIGALIMEKDVSEQLQNQQKMEALSEATETLSEILIGLTENRPIIPEMIEESLFFIDQEGKILYCNPSAINLIQEIGENDRSIILPLVSYFPRIQAILNEPEELIIQEVEMLNKVFQVKKIKLDQFDKANGMFVIFKNITELREKEKELIVKSVAIREIHHRVKNNLQTVASLLRLQMRRGLPEESKVHFVESLNRITSIASVYEVILSNSSVDDVDIYKLLEKIGNMLVWESEHENKKIMISYSGQHLQIKSNKAVSVALVINELIQNCVKHAFKTMDEGKIDVLFEQKGNDIEVQVIDNGEGYSSKSKPSLGLDIVRMMVEHDLSGYFSIQRTDIGTLATVTFPVEREMSLS